MPTFRCELHTATDSLVRSTQLASLKGSMLHVVLSRSHYLAHRHMKSERSSTYFDPALCLTGAKCTRSFNLWYPSANHHWMSSCATFKTPYLYRFFFASCYLLHLTAGAIGSHQILFNCVTCTGCEESRPGQRNDGPFPSTIFIGFCKGQVRLLSRSTWRGHLYYCWFRIHRNAYQEWTAACEYVVFVCRKKIAICKAGKHVL